MIHSWTALLPPKKRETDSYYPNYGKINPKSSPFLIYDTTRRAPARNLSPVRYQPSTSNSPKKRSQSDWRLKDLFFCSNIRLVVKSEVSSVAIPGTCWGLPSLRHGPKAHHSGQVRQCFHRRRRRLNWWPCCHTQQQQCFLVQRLDFEKLSRRRANTQCHLIQEPERTA